jgi:Mn-dependent DtxR family transcriptional regulator
MRPVAHLANLDLNLLVALRELTRERSVTRAAQRVGVTQPAASAALARLRRHFGDELLVREHGEYALTPLGEQLAAQVEAVCGAAERLFAASADFDPATSDREFTLVMADYTIMVMGEALSHALQRAAPKAGCTSGWYANRSRPSTRTASGSSTGWSHRPAPGSRGPTRGRPSSSSTAGSA